MSDMALPYIHEVLQKFNWFLEHVDEGPALTLTMILWNMATDAYERDKFCSEDHDLFADDDFLWLADTLCCQANTSEQKTDECK